ncbi:MAG: nuclear transport factor 2 family protein [Acidobacteria bacterium]|nr:nuclear transport factor 2 family protein [Acidobacteriota bacterium]
MDQNATLNGRIEQEFEDLDRGWVAAYLQGTTDLFDRVWADGFIFTSPFGQFTNKEREIADIKSGALSFESLATGDITVKVYGNTAVMAGSLTMKGRYKDRDISGQYSYTNVLGRQQQECWRIVASHAARLSRNQQNRRGLGSRV